MKSDSVDTLLFSSGHQTEKMSKTSLVVVCYSKYYSQNNTLKRTFGDSQLDYEEEDIWLAIGNSW